MQSRVCPALVGVPAASPNKSRIRWPLTAVLGLSFVWLALDITRILPIFSKLFTGIGVEIPLPTRALLSSPWWFLPAVFAVGALLAVAKSFVALNKLQLRVVNIAFILIGLSPFVVLVLVYLPLFMLVGKLTGTN